MARTKGSKTRCKYCFEIGHNTRTCKHLHNKINSLPSDDPHKARYEKKISHRTCRYCGEQTEHNIRTCPSLTNDVTKYDKLNKEFQNDIINLLDSKGIVIGNCFNYDFTLLANTIYDSETQKHISEYLYDVLPYNAEKEEKNLTIQIRSFQQITKIDYQSIDLYTLFYRSPDNNFIQTACISYYIDEDNSQFLINLRNKPEITKEKYNYILSVINNTIINGYLNPDWQWNQKDKLKSSFFLSIPGNIFNKYLNINKQTYLEHSRYEIDQIRTYEIYVITLNYNRTNNILNYLNENTNNLRINNTFNIEDKSLNDIKKEYRLFNGKNQSDYDIKRHIKIRNDEFLAILRYN
jgi:hypothetical protein